MIGAVTGKPVEQRMAGSLGGALAAVAQGAASCGCMMWRRRWTRSRYGRRHSKNQ
jgi:hypothetical protein